LFHFFHLFGRYGVDIGSSSSGSSSSTTRIDLGLAFARRGADYDANRVRGQQIVELLEVYRLYDDFTRAIADLPNNSSVPGVVFALNNK
jgi:hypothetical protein